MRIPATSMAANLMFTRSGVVWATWRLKGLAYGFDNLEKKILAKAHHQALYQAMIGESLLLGLCADFDPAVVVERMMSGVNMAESQEYLTEVELTFEELQTVPVGERAYWLSVPLRPLSPLDRAKSFIHSADAGVREQLALPKRFATQTEIEHALEAAREVEEAIPADFHPSPAGAAQMVWVNQHMQQRGLGMDLSVPMAAAVSHDRRDSPSGHHVISSGSELAEPHMDEGGQSDLTESKVAKYLPFKRRYLKVTHLTASEETHSYQTLMAMTGTPKGGFVFPGVEFISRLDDLPVDADFAIRLSTSPAAKVRQRNKKAENALEEQYGQQGITDSLIGGSNDLDEVAQAIVEYDASLNRTDSEVEVQATTIFAVGAPTPEEAKEKARYIADDYARKQFTFDAPLGGQEELWWAMQPGVPTSRLVHELAQITTGREFAFGIPMTSNELGDEEGFRIADNISAGRRSPMLMNPAGNMENDISGSFAAAGEQGGGKSVFLKTAAGHVVDRGGILFIIDRTPNREYASFAKSLIPSRTVILDVVHPQYSLDPLRIFGRQVGGRLAQSLLSVLLGIKSNSDEGALLARILKEREEVTSLNSLVDLLDSGAGLEGNRATMAQTLSDRIRVVTGTEFSDVLFDSSLPPLPMTAQATAILTDGLEQPTRDELMNESLKNELSVEKIVGRAIYALLAAIGKFRCFEDSSQMALFLVDECYHMTTSPEGENEIISLIRDGRKHKAAIALGSHDAKHDFGGEVLRGLIPLRFVFRCRDETIAKNNLAWLGLKEERWVETVMKHLSPMGSDGKVPLHRRGECLVRDSLNRFGKAQIMAPRNPARRKAVLTTPPKAREKQKV